MVIVSEWNAVVGEGAEGKDIGKSGLGKRNSRGEKLAEFCNRRELIMTNTWFQHEKRRRCMWKSPGDVSKYQLDYILIRQRYRKSVKKARAMRRHRPQLGRHVESPDKAEIHQEEKEDKKEVE